MADWVTGKVAKVTFWTDALFSTVSYTHLTLPTID